jgi:hypothetical protein
MAFSGKNLRPLSVGGVTGCSRRQTDHGLVTQPYTIRPEAGSKVGAQQPLGSRARLFLARPDVLLQTWQVYFPPYRAASRHEACRRGGTRSPNPANESRLESCPRPRTICYCSEYFPWSRTAAHLAVLLQQSAKRSTWPRAFASDWVAAPACRFDEQASRVRC